MRTIKPLAVCMIPFAVTAQVHVDRPVVLMAADPAERTVQGLASATSPDNLIDLEGARSGKYHWAQAAGTGMSIALTLDPPMTAYTNGTEIRFMPVAHGYGPVKVNVDGLGPRGMYRSDGLPVSMGQLAPGAITSITYADTAFFIIDRDRPGCPNGFLPVNGQYCIQRNDTLDLSVFNAAKWCGDRGARLCTWGEYIHACLENQSQMEGMFNDWEWVDDTADHTHTGVQAGRYQCRSERSWGALEDSNNFAPVRCCFTLR